MTDMEMTAKLEALLSDEEFSEKALQATSIEEIAKLLQDNGIDATAEELQKCGEEAVEILKKDGYLLEDGELSEKMLDMVSGGKKLGKNAMWAGAGMIALALASDYLAGACAVALVSNPAGWFFGGVALMCYGAYRIGKKR